MKVYVVHYDSDKVEGRGSMVFDRVFKTRKLAEDYCRLCYCVYKPGDWSGWATITECEVIDTLLYLETERRDKALAKLTTEEKKLLGLEKI